MSEAEKCTLQVSGAHVAVAETPLLRDASFSLSGGELAVLLGPNGAGKTTLLRAALGFIEPQAGETLLDGVPTHDLTPAARAQKIAYLPQMRPLAWPMRVRDIISMGRFSYGAALGRLGAADKTAVDKAIVACSLTQLAERNADTLSGGELARMHCARAFAAQPPLLVADEPVAALDPLHQHQIMSLIRQYVDDGGGALCVLHDISLAAQYADRLLWMKDGVLIADGTPKETLTTDRLTEVYGVKSRLTSHNNGIDVQIEGPA